MKVPRLIGPFRCLGLVVLGTGYVYRPSFHDRNHDNNNNNSSREEAAAQTWWNPKQLQYPIESPSKPLPLLVTLSRQVVLFFGVSISRAFLTLTGEFSIVKDKNYMNFLERVIRRPTGTPLITVSNHRSLLDEPTLFSSMLPYFLNIQPKFIRYSICAQEYCFNERFGSIIHGIVGLGKVLPVKRGAGVSQPMFAEVTRVISSGNWLHIFPEGGIWQLEGLGGRKDYSVKGKLKWGVGRLIAHAPQTPIVISFYITGMETIMPHDHETKRLLVKFPQIGHNVKLMFGNELVFDDLLAEYENQHGKLWKFVSTVSDEDHWRNPTPAELDLYSKITLRIEGHISELGIKMQQQL